MSPIRGRTAAVVDTLLRPTFGAGRVHRAAAPLPSRGRHARAGRGLLVTALALVLALGGCARVNSILGRDDNSAEPSPLPTLANPITIEEVWSRGATSGARAHYLKLVPAFSESLVFVAGFRGEVTAIDQDSGDERWSVDTDLAISGGLGYGEGLVVLGTEEGEVAAIKADDGEVAWTVRVSSEILAPPQIADGMVVVRTIDGKVFGLRSEDGNAQWVYDRSVPALSLRGTSAPVLYRGLVVSGFDSGRLVGLLLRDGNPVWETRVATPAGRTELQRIVDVDAEPVVRDDQIFAVTYQGRVVAVDARSGETLWRREMSSHTGVAVDHDHLYVTDAEGVVWAMSRDTSASQWRQEKLKARHLGTPGVFRDFVLVGDFEGYLHWLRRDTGEVVGRIRVDDEPILVRPTVRGDKIYVLGNGGTLSALRLP